jgi:predicted  nucleic acid-binding Zn-ribbon protein
MSALHELLDERQRYQGWLATLEGRRSSTPPHVYERVQQDYVTRLDRVMQALAERAGQLSGTIAAMTAELATLRQHESDRTDERHEAELRAAVGEFTPDDWERRRAEADSDLERIAAERHSLEEELDELQRIVALTRSIKTDGAAAQSPGASTTAAQQGRTAGSETADTGPSIQDFIAEWHPAAAGGGEPRRSESAAEQRRASNSAAEADLGDAIIPAAPMGGNPVGAAGADYGMANGVTGVSGLGPNAPTRNPPPVPAAMGDSRRDADKTLKCPECGAMNYATEWYCERCGGELSTF